MRIRAIASRKITGHTVNKPEMLSGKRFGIRVIRIGGQLQVEICTKTMHYYL